MELPANTSTTASTELENLGKEQVLAEETDMGCPESETPNAISGCPATAIPATNPEGSAAAVPATVPNGYSANPRGSQTATIPTTVAKCAKGPATAKPASIAHG